MVFNKYFKIYNQIIDKALLENRTKGDGYYENHHIIPKSINPALEKDSNNQIILTAKEHYLCHALLPKFLEGKHKAKMVYAFHMMNANSKGQKRPKNSILYEKNKIEMSKIKSFQMKEFYSKNLHPCKGKTYEEISGATAVARKEKISKYNKSINRWVGSNNPGWQKFGKLNPFYGKTHTTKTRKQISEANKGMNTGINNPMFNPGVKEKHKESINKRLFYFYLYNLVSDEEYLFHNQKEFEDFARTINTLTYSKIVMRNNITKRSFNEWRAIKIPKDITKWVIN